MKKQQSSRTSAKETKSPQFDTKIVSKIRLGRSSNAVHVNQMAVSLIQANRPDEAMRFIKKAFRHILHSLQQSTVSMQQQPKLSITSQVAPPIQLNEEQRVSPDGIFAFYNSALTIRGPTFDESVIPLLLYNLGLIYHRRAIELGSSPRLLRAALRMYQQAQKFDGPDILTFALMNNMGHALSCLFEHEAVKVCQLHFATNRYRYRKLISPEKYCILQPNTACAPMA
jgi:tetratricopeptide (TPR) repeat protein